ncbi:hypothetical protein GCM10023074_39570 [Microbispora amethystogenes]|uniref:Transposase n=1 Tax=Microbispora amethystogenes TaxID=1427754 RepID=A0ABQ4FCT5_9ACTN|nr:hypothetical protein Mam01_28010 [Microbispora amethystogenes]
MQVAVKIALHPQKIVADFFSPSIAAECELGHDRYRKGLPDGGDAGGRRRNVPEPDFLPGARARPVSEAWAPPASGARDNGRHPGQRDSDTRPVGPALAPREQ